MYSHINLSAPYSAKWLWGWPITLCYQTQHSRAVYCLKAPRHKPLLSSSFAKTAISFVPLFYIGSVLFLFLFLTIKKPAVLALFLVFFSVSYRLLTSFLSPHIFKSGGRESLNRIPQMSELIFIFHHLEHLLDVFSYREPCGTDCG